MFGVNKVEFREKTVTALYRAQRATRLTAKEIAYALGMDSDSYLNWSKGQGTLNGAIIDALDALFCSHGYYGFIEDIYGEVFARRRDRALKLQQEAARLKATAEMMEVA